SSVKKIHIRTSSEVIRIGLAAILRQYRISGIRILGRPIVQLMRVHRHAVVEVEGLHSFSTDHHCSTSHSLGKNIQIETFYFYIVGKTKSHPREWIAKNIVIIIVDNAVSI